MSLSTEFEGINPKKVDARIDALRQEIEDQLNPIIQELQQTRALERTTVSWYSDNTADTVHGSANGEQITRSSIEQTITPSPESVDTNDGSELSGRVEKLMTKRPGFSLGAFFKGQVRNQKVTFLDDLKEKGEALLVDATRELEQAQASLEQARDKQWEGFEGAQGFYDDLTQAITAQDTNALLTVIQSDAAKTIPAHQRKDLLLKPMNAHGTAMLAIADIEFTDPKKEAEVVGTVLSSLSNDLDALQLADQTTSTIDNEETRSRYQSYANAFSGSLLPVGEMSAVNPMRYGYASYGLVNMRINGEWKDTPALYLRDSRGNGPEYPMDEKQAEAFLNALAQRPTHIATGTGSVVNVNTYGYAAYGLVNMRINGEWKDTPALYFRDSRGNGPSFPMEEAQANTFLDALAERPTHISTGTGAIVNINAYGYAAYGLVNMRIDGEWQKTPALYLRDTRGNGPEFAMDADQAQIFLTAMAERPAHIPTGTGAVVNVNAYGRAGYGPVRMNIDGEWKNTSALYLRDTRGNGPEFAMDESQARIFLEATAERSTHIAVNPNAVVNSNAYGRAGYGPVRMNIDGEWQDTPAIYLRDSRGNGPEFAMEADEARAFIKSYRQLGQRLAIIRSYGAQHDQLLYGLNEARAWESDYRNTHQDSDTLMDYLPLIIVGAVILFDDHGQPDMHDLDAMGDQAGLDGTGVKTEFADASGLNEMDATMDNDFGVDSFEADFADMDTGVDGGFDDFDAGGGMDMGGGMDTSSDFGGSDFGSFGL